MVEAIGDQVTRYKVGDEVYVRLPEVSRGEVGTNNCLAAIRTHKCNLTNCLEGSWSECVKCSESYIAPKPKNISFAEAASLPLAGVTALQVLRQYKGSLEGKTVFVPAGCKSSSPNIALVINFKTC